MRWTTHMATGMAIATLAGQPLVGVAIAGVSALAPDIDSRGSKLGRKLPVISTFTSLVFGHRGALHSLLAIVALYLVGIQYFPDWVIPIIIGYASHIIIDSFTPSKIPWLWPYKKRFGLALIRTNSIVDILTTVALVVFLGYYWAGNIY